MTDAYARPVIVRDNDDTPPVALERVPLTGPSSVEAYSEDWLQTLLYKCPEALPIAEIDGSVSRLIPVCREMSTLAGSSIDIVYVTPRRSPRHPGGEALAEPGSET